MKRTTIFLAPETERDLHLYAEREGRSTASVVREALAQWLQTRRAAPVQRPGFVASGQSGRADVAERHDSMLFAGLEPHAGAPARASVPSFSRKNATPRPRSKNRVRRSR